MRCSGSNAHRDIGLESVVGVDWPRRVYRETSACPYCLDATAVWATADSAQREGASAPAR